MAPGSSPGAGCDWLMGEAAAAYWASGKFRKARAAAGGPSAARAGSAFTGDAGSTRPRTARPPKASTPSQRWPRFSWSSRSCLPIYQAASCLLIQKGNFLSSDYPGTAMQKRGMGSFIFPSSSFFGACLNVATGSYVTLFVMERVV